jgi:hypothetical protein
MNRVSGGQPTPSSIHLPETIVFGGVIPVGTSAEIVVLAAMRVS